MATLGDILLLTTTYKEPSGRYPHQVSANLDRETRELIESVVIKLNMYSEDKVSTSSVARMLIMFAVDSLDLSGVLDSSDTLCSLPEKSTVLGNIRSLSSIADVVNANPKDLIHIENVKGGHPLK